MLSNGWCYFWIQGQKINNSGQGYQDDVLTQMWKLCALWFETTWCLQFAYLKQLIVSYYMLYATKQNCWGILVADQILFLSSFVKTCRVIQEKKPLDGLLLYFHVKQRHLCWILVVEDIQWRFILNIKALGLVVIDKICLKTAFLKPFSDLLMQLSKPIWLYSPFIQIIINMFYRIICFIEYYKNRMSAIY